MKYFCPPSPSIDTIKEFSMSDPHHDVLTNVARPNTSATLTIRIIKSFTFRTERSFVLHDVNLVTTTVTQLKEIARQSTLLSSPGIMTTHTKVVRCGHSTRLETVPKCCPRLFLFRTLRSHYMNSCADTLKLYTKAHGAKVFIDIINLVVHLSYVISDI